MKWSSSEWVTALWRLESCFDRDNTRKNKILPWYMILTLNPLTWKIWWAPNTAVRWKMGFNSAFKGLKFTMGSRFCLSVGLFSTSLSLKCNLKFIALMTCENVTDNVFRYTEYSSVIFRIMGINCNQTDFDQILIALWAHTVELKKNLNLNSNVLQRYCFGI